MDPLPRVAKVLGHLQKRFVGPAADVAVLWDEGRLDGFVLAPLARIGGSDSVVTVQVDGVTVDPSEVQRAVVEGDDVQLTLPDGRTAILEGLIGFEAVEAPGGLAGADGEAALTPRPPV